MTASNKNLTGHSDDLWEPHNKDLSFRAGTRGLPVLGHTIAIAKDKHGFLDRYIKKYGLLPRVGMGYEVGLMVTHPDHLEQVYLDKDRNFSSEAGYRDSIRPFFPGAFIFQDFDEHKINRRIFQGAFKSEAIKGYVDIINPTIDEYVQQWDRIDDFRFATEIRHLLLDIAGRAFFGISDLKGSEIHELRKNFLDMLDGISAVIRFEIPGLAYHKGMKAKRQQEEFLKKCFQNRRANPGKDIASIMVHERDEDGNTRTDEELIPHMNILLFAGHDTTSALLSHLMMYLADPRYHSLQEKLREDVLALNKKNPSYEDLDNMISIDQCLSETLRLHPSAPIMIRRTVRDCTMGDVEIPAHTLLFIFNDWAHRQPEWWTHPDQFDPDRFSPGREEHKKHLFSYVPFGGGAHKCIGMRVAYMEAKLTLHHLLRTYRFTLKEGYTPTLVHLPQPLPSQDLPITFTRL